MFKNVIAPLVLSAACCAVLADPVEIEFLGAIEGKTELISFDGGVSSGRYLTGRYQISVDGEIMETFCLDPLGTINEGDSWTAEHFGAAEIADGNGLLFSDLYTTDDDVALEKYAMISYLANQSYSMYTDAAAASFDEPGERSDLSLMYWEIALDYDGTAGSLNLGDGDFRAAKYGNSNSLLAGAFANKDNAVDMAVYTPSSRPSQEFLAIKKVPEPASMIMLLMGMGALFGFRRRKKA